jgi:hydroxymethylglutaryl-CoA lyase
MHKNFITVNEVGPRDGLQNIPKIINTEGRIELIKAYKTCGITSVEIGSFVSPKAVPAMEGTELVIDGLNINEYDYSVLIPNLMGFNLASQNEVKIVCMVLCMTESFNLKNINKTISESKEEYKDIIKRSKEKDITTKIYLSASFGCPYEGKVKVRQVLDNIDYFLEQGIDEIVIADTIGAANPKQVNELFRIIEKDYQINSFSAHFHDTRAMALSNVYASLQNGVTKFDSSIGGLGGCPFAPGASGNLATEDLVSMLHQMDFNTGIDLVSLLEVVNLASRLTGLKLQGRMNHL